MRSTISAEQNREGEGHTLVNKISKQIMQKRKKKRKGRRGGKKAGRQAGREGEIRALEPG